MNRAINRRLCAIVAAALISPTLAGVAEAQPAAQLADNNGAPSRSIMVPKDKSVAFRLDAPIGELVVAAPEIAQIVATTDRSFYVRGKALGSTNILAYDTDKHLVQVIDVRVGADADALRADLAASLPGEKLNVRNMGDGFLLTGQVSTPAIATKAVNLAEHYAPKAVTSSLTVRDSQQVMLEVRVIEASRSSLQDIGVNVTSLSSSSNLATGTGLVGASPAEGSLTLSGHVGAASLAVTLAALESKGIIRTLAKPTLVAVSGESAEFLAGGEFPFPIPVERDQVAIEFKPFGVKLKFTPTVQDNGLIRLKVEPEVSQLDARNSLRINGFDVPSLTVRRTATTVDLRNAQSFAVAGLFQQSYSSDLRGIPGINDIPVLGALFRSSRWQRQETELVILITPHTGDLDGVLPNPLADGREPSAIDLILSGVALDRKLSQPVGADSTPAPTKKAAAVEPAADAVAGPKV